MEELSMSRDEALDAGLLIVGAGSRVASSVRIVPREDNGEDFGPVTIGEDCIVRDNVVLGTGTTFGNKVLVGFQCVFRRNIRVGDNVTFAHIVSIQRDIVIGNRCRVSALTHLAGGTVLEDDVQIGAGVMTVDDNTLRWPTRELKASVYRRGSRIGSGCTILGGLEIGEHTLVGAGSLVTRSLPPGVVAYGTPAYVQRDRTPDEIGRNAP